MKRLWVGVALGFLAGQRSLVCAQDIVHALQEELNDAAQKHQDLTAQNLATFFQQVDQAMGSPDAAVALWQQAGGPMPAPTPVTTAYSSETASERDARQQKDQANAAALGILLQAHCGLLHYAATFATNPKQAGLQDQFLGWLKNAAQAYPQLGTVPNADGGNPGGGQGQHRHYVPGDSGFGLSDIKGKTMHDSLIAQFLGFKSWSDSDAGGWSVKDIPKLYKTKILDPLRTTPSQAALDAWDVYISMEKADEPDNDKWTLTDYPPLQFDRACDDYAITPSSEKLEALVQIIHANPTHPNADDWITRTKALLDDYGARHGVAPAAAQNTGAPPPAAAATNGNVTVTTEQVGDAQVITTHTNAMPNPAQPH